MDGEETQPPQTEQPEQVDPAPADDAVAASNNGDVPASEGAMDGEQAEDAEHASGEDAEETVAIDYSHDQRVCWMVECLNKLDEFNISKLSNDKLQKFFDFLENFDYLKFFVWLNNEGNVEISYDSAPKFFELNIPVEQYQVAFFIKRSGKEQITISRIDQQLISGQIEDNPLDDLL